MPSPEQPATPPTPGSIPPPYGTPGKRGLFRPADIQDIPGVELSPKPRRRAGKIAAGITGVTLLAAGLALANQGQGQESPADFCAGAKAEFLNPSHEGQAVDGNEGILVTIQTKDVPAGCGVTILDEAPGGGYYRDTQGLESLQAGGIVTIEDAPIGSEGEVDARYNIVVVAGGAACATAIGNMEWDRPYGLPANCDLLAETEIIVSRP